MFLGERQQQIQGIVVINATRGKHLEDVGANNYTAVKIGSRKHEWYNYSFPGHVQYFAMMKN